MSSDKKWILVTGATAGIGYATAEIFAKNGDNIIITGRRENKLKELAEKLQKDFNVKVLYYAFDIKIKNDVQKFIEDIKSKNITPDVLVNNAGLSRGLDKLQNASFDDWEEMIDTNIKGLLYISRLIVEMMVKVDRGHIINLGSIAAYQPYTGGSVYNATKFAVRAISDVMNLDLVDTKIRVTAVHPGMVDTEFSTVRFNGDKDRADSVYNGIATLTADDIADIILYVASLPERVNVQHITVTPTQQRSINIINRNNIFE